MTDNTEKSTDRQARVEVSGMHCAACSSRIEKVVSTMDGVKEATVNLGAETLDVSWDQSQLSYDDIKKRVADLGFSLADWQEIPARSLDFAMNLFLKSFQGFRIS